MNPFLCRLVLASVLFIIAVRGSAADPAESSLPIQVRARVIIDNDFGGDPDGLFHLVHQLLSPSVEVRAIIGSRNYPGGAFGRPPTSAYSCEIVRELLGRLPLKATPPVLAGAEGYLEDSHKAFPSEGARFIVTEALREDTTLPLYVVCGAGLTNIASAYLLEPKIASRVRLIWIGGPEYAGLALPPPGSHGPEYNLGIDVKAVQTIFNESDISLWQVPRDAYRLPIVSYFELQRRVRTQGAVGAFLVDRVENEMKQAGRDLGETYVLGDSPLVLLTALQTPWERDPASSRYVLLPAPKVDDAGQYQANPGGRQIRVYTSLDVRLLFEDFYAKLETFAKAP